MTVEDAVFGGVEHAREKALELVREGVRTIIAVTSCIPGMNGDDLTSIQEEVRQLGCEMYLVRTDGVEVGDYNQGGAVLQNTGGGSRVGRMRCRSRIPSIWYMS